MFNLSSPWLTIGAAALFFAGVFGVGYTARGYVDAPIIERGKTAVAEANKWAAQATGQLAQQQVGIERARVNAVQQLRDREIEFRDALAKSRDERLAAERKRDELSNQLKEDLRRAPETDTRPLSPSVRTYLRGVRGPGAAAGGVAPADH